MAIGDADLNGRVRLLNAVRQNGYYLLTEDFDSCK